jgi:hypothetical protein
METKKRMSKEESDKINNLIVTMVKIYPFNIDFALSRVCQLENINMSNCRTRWYGKLRWQHQDVFKLVSDHCSVSNTKSISTEKIEESEISDMIDL